MFAHLFRSLRALPRQNVRPARRSTRLGRRLESLEPRWCPAAPSLMGLMAATGSGHNVTISGYVQDENPATAQVNFGGVVSGSVTPNAQGFFQFNGTAANLGAVTATAVDVEGLSSNTAQSQLMNQMPGVSFNVMETGPNRTLTVSGRVTDDAPGGLSVTLSGIIGGTVTTDANGNFSVTAAASTAGTITANVSDLWGQAAMPTSVNFQSMTPTISSFMGTMINSTTWSFTGTVSDATAAGLTVTFGGLLSGYSAIVQSNGGFSLTASISTSGTATAITTDWWGLVSTQQNYYVYVM